MNAPGRTVLGGGTVVDGRRGEPRRADVTIEGGRITDVGLSSPSDRSPGATSEVIDVSGLTVAPGFIDAHSHADFTLPRHPSATALVKQGCTSVVTGNCGFSPWPFVNGPTADAREHGHFLDPEQPRRWRSLDEFSRSFRDTGVGVNIVPLCGHGAARSGVVGPVDRAATTSERDLIVATIATALDDGAFGVSLGLSYAHGRYADRQELTAVALAAAARDAVLTVHLRDEGAQLLDAVAEMTTLAAATGCKLQLSHHKAAGFEQYGLVGRSLAIVDDGRAGGIDVAVDAYPYTMGATTVAAALPDWCTGTGDDELRRIVTHPGSRERLLEEIRAGRVRFTLPEVWIADASPRWTPLTGGLLTERAHQLGLDPAEALLDVVADDASSASMLVFCMAPDDVTTVLRHPGTLVGSDGWVMSPTPGVHPRNFQTFPQMLERGFRDRIGLELGEIVARMTGDVAARFGVTGRGVLVPGAAADVVVFDPDRIRPGGDLGDPAGSPHGIEAVFVNGVSAEPGARVAHLAGQVLRRPPRTTKAKQQQG